MVHSQIRGVVRADIQTAEEQNANNVAKWSVEEVCAWAANEGFAEFTPALRTHRINGAVLPLLSDTQLKEVGFNMVGPRLLFQNALRNIQRGARMARRNEVIWEGEQLRLGPCGGLLPFGCPCCCIAQPPAHYKLNHYKLQISEAVVPCGGLCACFGYAIETDNMELAELEDIDVQITQPNCAYGEGIITITAKDGRSRHLIVDVKTAHESCQKIQMAHEEAELRIHSMVQTNAPGQAF